MTRSVRRRIRSAAFVAAAALLSILVFQNLEPRRIQVLFWSIDVAPAALMAVVYLLGILTGVPLARSFLLKRGDKPREGKMPR